MSPADRQAALIEQQRARIKKLEATVQRQRTDLGNKDKKLEAINAESVTRRRILQNALDDAPGWRDEAKQEMTKYRRIWG